MIKCDSEFITTDANNLLQCAIKVRKTSKNKKLTQEFHNKRLNYVQRGQEELSNRTWHIEEMPPFLISERGHIRKIQGNTPYDRMILHSYIDCYLEPRLRKYLIYDNYASQEGKGTEVARMRFRNYLSSAYREYNTNKFYILTIDFRKFYDNVVHQIIYDRIMEKIPYTEFDEFMLWTIFESFKQDVSWMTDEEYATCYDDVYVALDHLYNEPLGEKYMYKSLNIGNQASQLFSIFFPTPIDNYCKIVRGIKRYGRYMDDISIIHKSKDYLWSVLDGIRPICDSLKIHINNKKTHISRADCEFKYLNRLYSVTPTGHIKERLAPDTIYREQRRLKKLGKLHLPLDGQFNSWIGSFGHHMSMWEIDRIYQIKKEVEGKYNYAKC